MSVDGLDTLNNEIVRIYTAIRKHRDYRGNDRCWLDDEELYQVLPEGYTPPLRDSLVELDRCRQFIACRHNPATEYISPQQMIEELQAEVDSLRQSLSRAYERIVAQSELLSRRAERPCPDHLASVDMSWEGCPNGID